jgi:hypothetical protein
MTFERVTPTITTRTAPIHDTVVAGPQPRVTSTQR